jgi:hypothetical protein
MKYTLLELTQRILESMNSDEVNSIGDTEESMTVANIIKECYFEIIGRADLPETDEVFQLTASGDNTKPTVMYVPEQVLKIKSFKYIDSTKGTYEPQYIPFDEFTNYVALFNTDEDFVDSLTVTNALSQTFTFNYKNNEGPNYYTSFDDNTLIFDSYNEDDGVTLVGAKTICYGPLSPTWSMTDNFYPDLDVRQFQLLLQAAKAQAFVEIKQVENPKAERKERRNEILAQRTKDKVDPRTGLYRGYGRK